MTADPEVILELEPNTVAALHALPSGIYRAIDETAHLCNTRTPDWTITVRIGTAAVITATPRNGEHQ